MKSLILLGLADATDKAADGILSVDQSKELRYMDATEAKSLLRKIFVKIDSNNSNDLDRDETVSWIRQVEHDHVDNDTKIVFDDYDKNNDGYLK